MSDWRNWQLPDWNERLLVHFFGRRPGEDAPVVALLTTPEELARVAGDVTADPSEVRDRFLARLREAIGPNRSLFDDAANYQHWPKPPPPDRVPRFVSHLIFSCIAASESSEELASEGSYLLRLRELAGGTLPDYTLQWLPRLWANLAAWLAANARQFRALRLPDPGGYTRIGYSVKLAFPDRRDQRVLSEVLGRAGLQGHEPPVAKVIALVAASRGQFRQAFQQAFDDFRSGFANGAHEAREIHEHRFWSAVRDAALRGRGAAVDGEGEHSSLYQLLCEEQDDRLHLFLVTDEAIAEGRLRTTELPVTFDRWRYAVIENKEAADAPEGAYATARDVLTGRIAIPRLSSHVAQGLVPLVEGVHGCLELAGPEQLEQSRTVLAREERAKALITHFGKGRARSNPSVYRGWVELRGLELRRLSTESLEETTLVGCWQLYDSVVRPAARLQGGVRADDGWLGFREILPHITVSGASEIVMIGGDGRRETLRKDEEGVWQLPVRDLEGEFQFEISLEASGTIGLSARFNRVVAGQDVRLPDQLDAWILEGLGGTTTLAGAAPLRVTPSSVRAPTVDLTFHLGPVVGEFLDGPEHAAWSVSRFAGKSMGARCRPDLAEASGIARVPDISARRRWRQLLFNCRPDPSDEGFNSARSRIRQRVVSTKLPTAEGIAPSTQTAAPRNLAVAVEVDRLLAIAAARAGGRTGIPFWEWSNHVERVMGLSRERMRALTRSWAEAGILDVAFYARWRHRSVFLRSPTLVGFRTEKGFAATILGFLLPTTRRGVQLAARQVGVELEERAHVTTLAPAIITMRCSRQAQLEAISKSAGIPLRWLELETVRYAEQCRHDGLGPAPQNYDERTRWARWSLGPGLDASGISFTHCVRAGCPDYWHVEDGDRSVWSFDLNTARLWGLAMLRQKPLAEADGAHLMAEQAFLPLPMARCLAIINGTAPGVGGDGRYRYPCASAALSRSISSVLESIFDPQRLHRHAQVMMG
ncbi:hypothetical protein [Bradyrhizobium diazoefficiens]